MPKPQTWLQWTGYFMPHERSMWLSAMEAELSGISDNIEGQNFAIGCFKTALFEAVRSRRGLQYIARASGAFLIFFMSLAGILVGVKLGSMPETIAVSRLIIGLCMLYMAAAALFVLSLKGLQIYASIGFSFAISGWIYCISIRPKFDTLPIEFLKAISIEAAGFMAGLLLAVIYLNWLYTPRDASA